MSDTTTALEHERMADWDAAYALDALAPDELAAFERHLPRCDRCAASTNALLDVLPSLASIDAPPSVDAPPSAPAVRPRRRARLRRRLAAGMLAAALVAGVVASLALASWPTSTTTLALAPVDGAPLHAEVELVDVDGGAEVTVHCGYDEPLPAGSEPWTYDLVVETDGVERVVATWTAPPSGTVTASGTVDGSADAIDAIQVVASDTGQVVLELRR